MGWCMASSALFARGNKEARGVCQIALSRGTRTCTSGICLREAEELNLDFGAVLFHGRSAPESGLKNPESPHMFIGEYTHSVDDKKRLSVPAKFRKELGKKAVVTIGLNKCLSLYPVKGWNMFAEKLSKLSMGKSEDRGFSRAMLSGAFEVEIDRIGRILIPDALKDFAGLKGKVVLTGVYDRVEVWEEGAWRSYKEQMVANTDRMAEQLGERGVF